MNATDGLILWLGRTSRAHQPMVGEKAALLGELAHRGFPVPPGFTITTRVFSAFLEYNNLTEAITRRLGAVSADNPDRLLAASNRLMKQVLQGKMPEEAAATVVSAYHKLGGGPVAVWADGVNGASDNGSAPGYLFSQCNVQSEQGLLDAVRQGWASAFAPREVHYRADHDRAEIDMAPAVMVQRMVQPEVSGVLMTLDPIYNDDSHVVVEAVWGLGRVLSEEPVTPEVFILEKSGFQVISRKLAVQRHKMVQNPAAAPGAPANTPVDLSEEESLRSRLSGEQLEHVARLGCAVETALGEPVEVEWAKSANDDTFYVLQVRPLGGFSASGRAPRAGRHEMTGKLLLTGDPVTPGLCSGKVRVLASAGELEQVKPGDVVVLPSDGVDYTAAVRRAGAVILDQANGTSPAAVLCEQLGIPCVCATGLGSALLKPGQTVTVDGNWGRVLAGVVVVKSSRPGRHHHGHHHPGDGTGREADPTGARALHEFDS